MTHWAPWTDNTSYVGEKTPSHKKTQKIFVTPGCLSLSGHFESVWGNCLSLWSGFVSLSRIFCSRRIGGPWSSWVLTSAYICVQQRMYYKDNADCLRSFFLLRKGQNHLFYIFTSDKQTYNLSHKNILSSLKINKLSLYYCISMTSSISILEASYWIMTMAGRKW